MTVRIIVGDAIGQLRTLPDASVHCCVTSPPYWGLRDYQIPPQVWGGDPGCAHEWGYTIRAPWANSVPGPASGGKNGDGRRNETKASGSFCDGCGAWLGSLGLEPTYQAYVEHLVEVFREVRRVLRPDGTLWLNLGDSYAGSWGNQGRKPGRGTQRPINGPMMQAINDGRYPARGSGTGTILSPGMKPKDLMMMPARVALALQADGWYLRSEIIWHKLNPMTENVRDRPTSAHEKIFLLSPSERYFYDAEAVREEGPSSVRKPGHCSDGSAAHVQGRHTNFSTRTVQTTGHNKGSVWTIATQPFKGWAYDFSGADYVDLRGIPRKWSPDCPIHERDGRLRPGCHEADVYGEPKGSQPRHTKRTDADPDREQPSSDAPIARYRGCAASDNPSDVPRPGNHSSKTRAFQPGTAVQKTSPRTIGIQEQQAPSTTDCAPRACSGTATPHSIGGHKNGRAGPTSRGDNASEKSDFHSAYTRSQPCGTAQDGSTAESNNAGCPSLPSERPNGISEPASRKSGKRIDTASTHDKCVCPVSQLSHFAVFPTKLVEPCILAGTSEHGVCAECGAPWARVVERAEPSYWEQRKQHDFAGRKAAAGPNDNYKSLSKGRPENSGVGYSHNRTTGWEPSCTCNAGVVPATVLDPFGGAGTTGLVADRLGRDAVLIELNPEYAAMSRRRLERDAGLFAQIAAE